MALRSLPPALLSLTRESLLTPSQGFEPNASFALGATIVIMSTFMYSNAKAVCAACPEACGRALL